MKVQIKNRELLQVLGHIQSIVEKKTGSSILSNVKIIKQKDKISFYTTDLDIFAKESIDIDSDGELTTTVPIHIFYDIIRKIEGDKEVQLIFDSLKQPTKMLIKTGLSQFSLPCLLADGFPDFEEGKHSCEFEILSRDLRYLITTTKHAIPYDETRYYLSGAFLHVTDDNGVNVLRAVTTDVHRLAVGEVILPKNAQLLPEIIIPKKTVFELIKLLEDFNNKIQIGVSSKKITLHIGNTTIVSKLIDGKFPDYNKAIPYKNSKVLEVSISKLSKAIDLITSISTEKIVAVNFKIKANKIILSVNDKINSSGVIEIPAIYDNDEVSISFNAKYIVDILNNLSGNKVYIKLNSSSAAVLLEDSDNMNCRFVLMPMQV